MIDATYGFPASMMPPYNKGNAEMVAWSVEVGSDAMPMDDVEIVDHKISPSQARKLKRATFDAQLVLAVNQMIPRATGERLGRISVIDSTKLQATLLSSDAHPLGLSGRVIDMQHRCRDGARSSKNNVF